MRSFTRLLSQIYNIFRYIVYTTCTRIKTTHAKNIFIFQLALLHAMLDYSKYQNTDFQILKIKFIKTKMCFPLLLRCTRLLSFLEKAAKWNFRVKTLLRRAENHSFRERKNSEERLHRTFNKLFRNCFQSNTWDDKSESIFIF